MNLRTIRAYTLLGSLFCSAANAGLWNVFNVEGESTESAGFATYSTLSDMLHDTNRTGTVIPGLIGRNIVGSASDGTNYWNVFNVEGESTESAGFATYSTLSDMLHDTNRTGTVIPGLIGRNIVGSASDGTNYWNVFNVEGESTESAGFATYSTLSDMLHDTNRTGTVIPGLIGRNIVGSASDGTNYWNVFNVEGESTESAGFATYSTLSDMLHDTNRTGTVIPGLIGRNIVGSGSTAIPEPSAFLFIGTVMLSFGVGVRFCKRVQHGHN